MKSKSTASKWFFQEPLWTVFCQLEIGNKKANQVETASFDKEEDAMTFARTKKESGMYRVSEPVKIFPKTLK